MASSIATLDKDPRCAPFVCAFDQTRHESLKDLHSYLREWDLKQEKYYQTYYPRKDPISGDLIPFKDLDQYLEQEFANKNTLKRWLKENPQEGYEWSKRWLGKLKKRKELVYAPSQVQLRTLCCPSMPYYEKMGAKEGGYYGVTRELGYLDRYTSTTPLFKTLPDKVTIIQDTREQYPIRVLPSTRLEALNVGDYALDTPYDIGVRIERKSLLDFLGTMSERKVTRKGRKSKGETEDSAYARFNRELDRAVEANLYVVMMVESTITDAQSFKYLPHTRHVKASAEYLLHNLRSLLVKYPLTFQCVFVNGRIEMARVMRRVFELGENVKTIDLQYTYERGLL